MKEKCYFSSYFLFFPHLLSSFQGNLWKSHHLLLSSLRTQILWTNKSQELLIYYSVFVRFLSQTLFSCFLLYTSTNDVLYIDNIYIKNTIKILNSQVIEEGIEMTELQNKPRSFSPFQRFYDPNYNEGQQNLHEQEDNLCSECNYSEEIMKQEIMGCVRWSWVFFLLLSTVIFFFLPFLVIM